MNWLLLPSVLLLGSVALAQEPTPSTPRRERATSQTEERAQSMRKQIGEGRAVQSHVKVLVRLKNGNRLVGVVKDGKLVERIDGLRFVEAAAGDEGAGIRIWYTAGTRNFVFVPFKDFASYEIVQQLSNEQVQQIENELGMDRGKSDVVPSQGDAAGAKQGPPAGEPAAGGQAKASDGKTTATDEQQKLWFDLLQAYPPTAGWGLERRDEIKRRFVVVGSQPSAAEKRFVDEYEQWSKACAYYGVTPATKAKAATPADPREAEKADRRARRGETEPAPTPGASGDDQRKEERRARRGLGGSQGGQGGGGD